MAPRGLRRLDGVARRLLSPYALGVAAAVVTFALSYGFGLLLGEPDYFMAPPGDPGWHIAAVAAYLREPWGWPLFHVATIYDEAGGTNLTLLDGIPGLALLLKAVVTVIPASRGFLALHCLAIWLLLSLLMQGIFAVRIVRACGRRDRLAALLAAVVAVTFPALHWRWQHTALTAHFEILWAFSLYLLAPSRPTVRGFLLEVLALCVLSALTHPYLFAMVAPLVMVAAVRRGLIVRSAVTVVAAVALAYGATGTLADIGTSQSRGFGYHGANLATFLFSKRSGIAATPVGWSEAPAMQQHEGYAYLGLGVLAALVWAMWRTRRQLLALLVRHWLMAGLLLSMFVFAASNRVYLGSINVFSVETMPGWLEPVANTFRCSGRFVWPLAYALAMFAVVVVARTGSKALVLAVLAIQVLDASGDMAFHRRIIHASVPAEKRIDRRLFDGFDRVHLEPPPTCHVSAPEPDIMQHFLLAASRRDLSASSSLVPRSLQPCEHVDDWSRSDTLTYVTRRGSALLMQEAGLTCTRMGQGYGCAPGPRSWPRADLTAMLVEDGELVKLRREAVRDRVLDSHWVNWWSVGTSPSLIFQPGAGLARSGFWLTLCAGGALGGRRPTSVVHVNVNDRRGGVVAFTPSNNAPTTAKSLFVAGLGADTVARVQLTVLDARAPNQVGIADEDKPIGVELWAFGVSAVGPLDCREALDTATD